jgi:hypothetical protein
MNRDSLARMSHHQLIQLCLNLSRSEAMLNERLKGETKDRERAQNKFETSLKEGVTMYKIAKKYQEELRSVETEVTFWKEEYRSLYEDYEDYINLRVCGKTLEQKLAKEDEFTEI